MKQRRIAAVLAGSLMTAALGAYVAPMAHADPTTSGAKLTRSEQDAISYWTPERLRSAKNGDVTHLGKTKTPAGQVKAGKKRLIRAVNASNQQTNAQGHANTGGKWTKGGKVTETTGKVFFTIPAGEPGADNYACSGSVAPANNKSIVITAGHCVNNADKHQDAGDGEPGTYVKNWIFIPDYNGNGTTTATQAPHGVYAATRLLASPHWINDANFNYDVGFATVGPQAAGDSNGALVANAQGSQGLGFNLPRHRFVENFGYPGVYPYNGTVLDYSAGPALNADENGISRPGNSTSKDDPNGSNDQVIESNLSEGSSGGPWFYNFDESDGTGTQMSVTSFGYDDLTKAQQREYRIPEHNSWGPYFGSAIEKLFDSVQGGPPRATDRSATTREDTATKVTLSGANPKGDPDPTALTYRIKTQPSHGKVTRSGRIATYTPDKNYNGTDRFTYVANNGVNNSAPATVTVRVTPVEDPPKASDVSDHTRSGKPVDITLKGTDPDKGDHLTYAVASAPSDGGKVKISGDTATYTPDPSTGATDTQKVTFTYTVSDGHSTSDPATASVRVSPNSKPVGHDDSYSVDSSDTLSVKAPGVLKNDTDADDDPLSAVLVGQVPDGLNFKPDGSFTYDAPKTYKDRTITFTYRATDGVDDSSSDAQTKAAPNEPAPLADSEDTTVTISVAAEAKPSPPRTPKPTPSPTEPPSSASPSPSEPPTSAPPSTQDPNGPLGDTGSPFSPAVIGFGLMSIAAGVGTLIAARRRRS